MAHPAGNNAPYEQPMGFFFSAPYVKRARLLRNGAAQINPCGESYGLVSLVLVNDCRVSPVNNSDSV